MNIESTLIEALSNLVTTPDPVIEYRLHYNESGDIFMCSMQSHPDSTQYIVVTKDQYERYFRYRVVEGKLELIPQNIAIRTPFVKSTKGFRVVKNHASLLLQDNEEYSDIEYYDTRNS